MPVEQVRQNLISPYRVNNIQPRKQQQSGAQNVSFQGGFNPVVGLMDFIAAGGYAASFCIQDGLGFIAPRVHHGLTNGGKEKKDENGNTVLDKNGKPEHELNWAYARKEGLRELITGPSAFLIPYFSLKAISKKFGPANRVKLNYIDSLQIPFADFAKENMQSLLEGKANKQAFYEKVFAGVIENSINAGLPDAEKMSKESVVSKAKEFAQKLINTENVQADKTLNKKEKAAKLAEIGSVENDYMQLRKSKIGGVVNEIGVKMTSSNGSLKDGSIGELVSSMKHFYDDASSSVAKVLKNGTSEKIEQLMKRFANKKMGSRFLTNIGLFLAVALFYTQIPKLYNMGLKSNPALGEDAEANPAKQDAKTKDANSKDVAFTGNPVGLLEKTGSKIFNNKVPKSLSDIFELNGGIFSSTAMPVLLYGFCIPPRLFNAQDKYDYKDILVRDMTSFTALLFGAKALARLFSDGFTKMTGLALNHKNMENRNFAQKVLDYLNPADKRHSVLSSKQLESKYTNIENYKNGVNGFVEFIEQSGGNVKKALAKDKNVKSVVNDIVKDFNGKSFAQASADEIKQALNKAHINKSDLMKKFYKLFESENGLLRAAKTCNSFFDFLSTLVLVPSLIIWLTKYCKKMTENARAKDKSEMTIRQAQQAPLVPSSKPTMAGFLNNAA